MSRLQLLLPWHWWRLARTLFRVLAHRQAPLLSKLLILLAAFYAVWPLDFIADWLLVLGWTDDLTIVLGLCALALKILPPALMEELSGIKPAGPAGGSEEAPRPGAPDPRRLPP